MKLFRSLGKKILLEDTNGDVVTSEKLTRRVLVDVKYVLRPSPQQPLKVNVLNCVEN